MANWLEKLSKCNWQQRSRCDECKEHKDYTGRERPTVLCDACWKIWFEAPKKDNESVSAIHNKRIQNYECN